MRVQAGPGDQHNEQGRHTARPVIWKRTAVVLLAVVLALGMVIAGSAAPTGAAVEGLVEDGTGAVAEARVRIRATENMVFSGEDGRFTLSNLQPGQEVEVTAWADGYYVASVKVVPPASGVTLTLRRYHTQDHPEYAWADPLAGDGACGNCHPPVISQWLENAHSSAVDNARFFSLYNGTDTSGEFETGPGYLLDFPGTAGNCAECHAPGAAADSYLTTNMNDVRGNVTAGIHCDYCHKIGDVYLNPATGSVYANTPGVRSQKLLRPPAGDNIFFGPFDDIHDPDTYLPLISESQYCAPCHQFSFWGTPIYESFNEWLASPYADEGITCQDCHMPPSGDSYFAPPEVGGLPHPPETLPSHFQLGAMDEEFLQESLTMTVETMQQGPKMNVTVTIFNSGAGHDWPTDHPGRHLLLTVHAEDQKGQKLPQAGGSRIPEWCGEQAGEAGTVYAKVLADAQTLAQPVVSYWKPSFLISDNRIPALASAVSHYAFPVPEQTADLKIVAELRFRRLFAETAAEKGWQIPDIVLARQETTVTIEPHWSLYLPLSVKP